MSVVKLMQQVRGHITFYKRDILQNLEGAAPEIADRDLAAPPRHPITQPTSVDLIPLPIMADHMPTYMSQKDAPGSFRAEARIVPTTGPVVQLEGPLIPSGQIREERQFMLIITASVRRLNLETTGVILGETIASLVGGLAPKNSKWQQSLGLTKAKREVGHPSTTIEEVTIKDLERGSQEKHHKHEGNNDCL